MGLLCRGRKFLIDRKWPKHGIINTDNTEQWLVARRRTGITISFLEFYGIMWDKCALSVLSIVCRTHLSHFPFFASMNVYEHIGHTSWDKCAPRQMCSYTAPHPPAQPKDTFMSWDGIYTCQFHAIVAIVYCLIKTYNAVIQLFSTCLGAAKVFI
jgi:hypothetical protein